MGALVQSGLSALKSETAELCPVDLELNQFISFWLDKDRLCMQPISWVYNVLRNQFTKRNCILKVCLSSHFTRLILIRQESLK